MTLSTSHAAGQTILAADINAIAAAVNAIPAVPTRASVQFAEASGAVSQVIPSGAFTTLQLGSEDSDFGGNYNPTTYMYTVPVTGVYEIQAAVRVNDSTAAGKQIGLGVHSSNADGPWFTWAIVGPTPATRFTAVYGRRSAFTAGAQLRLYVYADTGVTLASASMSIVLIAAG